MISGVLSSPALEHQKRHGRDFIARRIIADIDQAIAATVAAKCPVQLLGLRFMVY